MSKTIFILAIAIATVLFASCNAQPGQDKALKTETDSVSYALGVDIGSNVKNNLGAYLSEGTELDYDILVHAFVQAIDEKETKIKKEETMMIIQKFMQKEGQKKQAEHQEKAKANLEAGNKFLEENKTKEGVITLESGLQYEILKEGNGETPQPGDQVKCHYHGTRIDGTEFDSTQGEEPRIFSTVRVIDGWKEALKLMPVGSKWKLYVPGNLAYKERGKGDIEPNTTLIFELELLEIVTPEAKK